MNSLPPEAQLILALGGTWLAMLGVVVTTVRTIRERQKDRDEPDG